MTNQDTNSIQAFNSMYKVTIMFFEYIFKKTT